MRDGLEGYQTIIWSIAGEKVGLEEFGDRMWGIRGAGIYRRLAGKTELLVVEMWDVMIVIGSFYFELYQKLLLGVLPIVFGDGTII